MIVNAAGTMGLSNFRWVDAGTLWSYALGESESKQNHFSDSKWLTLVQGAEDYFAAVHHFEDGRVKVTAHSFRNISETISSFDLQMGNPKSHDFEMAATRFTGDSSAWSFLPRAYVVRPFEEAFLLLIDWSKKATQIQSLSWYKESYDMMYQGILDVREIPGSSFLIFSIQRDSEPVIYDHSTRIIVKKIRLGGRSGGPQLVFRRSAPELWASDYDTLVRLDSRDWNVLNVLKLQEAKDGMERLFIGEYSFNSEETICAVARPFSGDVVGIDPNTFTVTVRAETGGQPVEVGILRGDRVVARDWKTGRLLQGALRPV